MKYCRYCGKELPDDASFCIYCMQELNERKVEKKKRVLSRRLRNLIVLLTCVVFIIAGCIIFCNAFQNIAAENSSESNNAVTLTELDAYADEAGKKLIRSLNDAVDKTGFSQHMLDLDTAQFFGAHLPHIYGTFDLAFGGDTAEFVMTDESATASPELIFYLEGIEPGYTTNAFLTAEVMLRAYADHYAVSEGDTSFLAFLQNDMAYPYVPCDYNYYDHISNKLYIGPMADEAMEKLLNEDTVVYSGYKEGTFCGCECYFEVRSRSEADGAVYYDYTLIVQKDV